MPPTYWHSPPSANWEQHTFWLAVEHRPAGRESPQAGRQPVQRKARQTRLPQKCLPVCHTRFEQQMQEGSAGRSSFQSKCWQGDETRTFTGAALSVDIQSVCSIVMMHRSRCRLCYSKHRACSCAPHTGVRRGRTCPLTLVAAGRLAAVHVAHFDLRVAAHLCAIGVGGVDNTCKKCGHSHLAKVLTTAPL